MARDELIAVHVAGALELSAQHPLLTLFFHTDAVPKSPDTICSILFAMICAARRPSHTTLLLTFDDAGGENKNRYVLGLAGLLVKRRWFLKVIIILLPVGHTHHLIDQRHSIFQRGFSHRFLRSFADVVAALPSVFASEKSTPTAVVIESATAWEQFLDTFLAPLAGHRDPLGFLITADEQQSDRPIRLMWRRDSTSPWQGGERTEVPLQLFVKDPEGLPLELGRRERGPEDTIKLEKMLAHAAGYMPAEHVEALRGILVGNRLPALSTTAASEGIAEPARVLLPGKAESVAVRLLRGHPAKLDPPRPMPLPAASASASGPATAHRNKPIVLTNKPSTLAKQKRLLEAETASTKAPASEASSLRSRKRAKVSALHKESAPQATASSPAHSDDSQQSREMNIDHDAKVANEEAGPGTSAATPEVLKVPLRHSDRPHQPRQLFPGLIRE